MDHLYKESMKNDTTAHDKNLIEGLSKKLVALCCKEISERQYWHGFFLRKGCKIPSWEVVKEDDNFLNKIENDENYCTNKRVWKDHDGNYTVENNENK